MKSISYFAILVFLFLVFRGRAFSSGVLSNIGTLFHNHAAVLDNVDSMANMEIARQRLQLAVLIDETNDSAWRELGFVLTSLDKKQEAFQAWKQAPDIKIELLQWKQQAIRNADYDSALKWCQILTTLSPQLGDAWYCIGSLYQRQQEWQKALAAFSRAAASEEMYEVTLSDIYYEQGIIYRSDTEQQGTEKALEMFNKAITTDSFSSPIIKADTFYRRGEILLFLGRDPISEFQHALELNPEHEWARLRLAYEEYWASKNLPAAEKELTAVVESWTESNSEHLKWAYIYLGDVYRDAGMRSKSIRAYESALQLDPVNENVQKKLASLREE